MYIKLDGKIVSELVPDVDPALPNVPIEERYPADFIAELLHVEDSTEVEAGMEYDAETGGFGYPESDIPTDNITEEIAEDADGITQAEINLEVEYRLACLELGIN